MHRPKDSTTKFDGSSARHMAFETYSISNWRYFSYPQFNLRKNYDLWLKTEKRLSSLFYLKLRIFPLPSIQSQKELWFMAQNGEEAKKRRIRAKMLEGKIKMASPMGWEPSSSILPQKFLFTAVFPVFRSQNPVIVTHLCPNCDPGKRPSILIIYPLWLDFDRGFPNFFSTFSS